MTTSAPKRQSARAARTLGAAGWLALAASPVFAVMAWDAVNDPAVAPLCSAGSDILPLGSMPAMYVLMSVFHLPPWLKLRAPKVRT